MVKLNVKLLNELQLDARMPIKQLSSTLKKSPQLTSYSVNKLLEEGYIQNFETIVDTAKLGYIHIIALLNMKTLAFRDVQKISTVLKNHPHIISLEQCQQGVDFIAEFSYPNLSAFSKDYTAFLEEYNQTIDSIALYPVVVKHKFTPLFSQPRMQRKHIIYGGDRDIINLSPQSIAVLQALVLDTRASLLSIAQKLNISAKTVLKEKKLLEHKKIIKGYTTTFNLQKCEIIRNIVFLKLNDVGEYTKLVEFTKQNKNVTHTIKIIGDFTFALIIEGFEIKDVITQLRTEFAIERFNILPVSKLILQKYLPSNMS